MGHTKRGRERSGKNKRQQRRRRDIKESLRADEEPPSTSEDPIEL
jgi:hypothetical protein